MKSFYFPDRLYILFIFLIDCIFFYLPDRLYIPRYIYLCDNVVKKNSNIYFLMLIDQLNLFILSVWWKRIGSTFMWEERDEIKKN